MTRWRHSISTLLLSSTLLFGAAGAKAQEQVVPIDPVSVYGSGYYGTCPDFTAHYVFNVDWFGRDPAATQIFATGVSGPTHGTGVLSFPDVAVAIANATDIDATSCAGGSGVAVLTTRATIIDPLGRPSVKLRTRVKAAAATPGANGKGPQGYWSVTVASGLDNVPSVHIGPDGTITSVELPGLYSQRIFWIEGLANATNDPNGPTPSLICDSVGGCAYLDGFAVELDRTIGFDAAPGTVWLQLFASGSNGGLSVVDPVIEPDPDNPEVVVTMVGPFGSGGSAPLAGMTPDQLAAKGIDPTPFVNLGFFDAPSSEPPPPPPAGDGGSPPPPPKYWCGPGFWFKNATDFGASAWPASALTYYDYNSTAGQIAGCPTAGGNATLLQVLQNPSAYFGTQVKATAFNCVGDYLSEASGLSGTKTDNNGVCSIDQFGRHTE